MPARIGEYLFGIGFVHIQRFMELRLTRSIERKPFPPSQFFMTPTLSVLPSFIE
jgi:hypothetical protein